MCRPEVLGRCPAVLRDLNGDIMQCLRVLPRSVHGLLRRTKVWVNASYRYGPIDKPRRVSHSTAHHYGGWLVWARDKPEKARGIEIYNCYGYQKMRLHWNGAGLILHELFHLIHQLVLPYGLDNVRVKEIFHATKRNGRYEAVLRRDWAGNECEVDMAYCMVNHKEFFAEISVTYLAGGYRGLDSASSVSFEACSPPILSMTVKKRMTESQLTTLESGSNAKCCQSLSGSCCTSEDMGLERPRLNPDARILGNYSWILSRLFPWRRYQSINHCNKFYPFTRGQLSEYDPDLFEAMKYLWQTIEEWDDCDNDESCFELGCLGWRGEGFES